LAENKIPEKVKNFIFRYIDSVELLEVLLLFQKNHNQSWDAQSIAIELRSNPISASRRISFLRSLKLLRETAGSDSEYLFDASNPELNSVIVDLASAYQVQRHSVFELIFSPMKKTRDLANAFRMGNGPKDGRSDG
jgi:hypothetical protein